MQTFDGIDESLTVAVAHRIPLDTDTRVRALTGGSEVVDLGALRLWWTRGLGTILSPVQADQVHVMARSVEGRKWKSRREVTRLWCSVDAGSSSEERRGDGETHVEPLVVVLSPTSLLFLR